MEEIRRYEAKAPEILNSIYCALRSLLSIYFQMNKQTINGHFASF
jgi:hypothetical protein